MLVLDDVHWAAKPTLLMLRHVLRSGTPSRLLIVATYRDTDLDRTHPLADLLADLRRVPEVERLALEGLDRTGVEESHRRPPLNGVSMTKPRALAAAVHAETEGNPFFVGELLRHLARPARSCKTVSVAARDAVVERCRSPTAIREVIGRRLSRLSETANDVLAWSAVIGPRASARRARRGSPAATTRCLDALDEAVDARLVDEAGPGAGGSRTRSCARRSSPSCARTRRDPHAPHGRRSLRGARAR